MLEIFWRKKTYQVKSEIDAFVDIDAYAEIEKNHAKLQDENKWLKEELIEFGRHGQGCSRQWGTKYRCKCGWEKIEQALKDNNVSDATI